jgi:hypothetical protein
LYFGFSTGFSCQADNYKIPAQQQAVNIACYFSGHFKNFTTEFMRQFLLGFFVLIGAISFGQTSTKIDSLTFCFNKYKVPTGCAAESEYQIKCDNYSMVWLYMNEQMLQVMPDQFVNQMPGQLKKFKKEPITCYLLDKEVKGYKISFKTDNGTGHQLIAYGVANGQPVLVQLSLDNEPKTNDNIPDFPKQIIRLTK